MYLKTAVDPDVWKAIAGRWRKIPTVGSIVYYYPKIHNAACHGNQNGDQLPAVVTAEVKSVQLRANAGLSQDVFVKFRLQRMDDDEPARGEWLEDTAVDYFTIKLDESDVDGTNCFVPNHVSKAVFPPMQPQQPTQAIKIYDMAGEKWVLKNTLDKNGEGHRISGKWKEFIEQRGVLAGSKMVFVKKGENLTVGFKRGGVGAHPPLGEARRALETWNNGGAAAKAVVRYYPISGEECVFLKSAVDEAANIQWEEGMAVRMGDRKFRVLRVDNDESGPLLTIRRGGENDTEARPWAVTQL